MIEKFMTWLNSEIDDLRQFKGNNLMLEGKVFRGYPHSANDL